MGKVCGKIKPKQDSTRTIDVEELLQRQLARSRRRDSRPKRLPSSVGTTTSLHDIRQVYRFESNVIGKLLARFRHLFFTIGRGHFGNVRVARLISNPEKRFAIKTVSKEKIKDQEILLRELDILKHLDHPNIVKFYETYQDEKFFHFVMEYCRGGELLDRVTELGNLCERETACIMQKAFAAVKHLHEKNIVHRDLKPENFLFSHEGADAELKLIDFGLSRPFEPGQASLKTLVGTCYYVAPEVLKGYYNEKCDEWGLGVIMYLLLSGKLPFIGDTNREVFAQVLSGKVDFNGPEWNSISNQAKDLIRKLLESDPSLRITAADALQHPWFINRTSEPMLHDIDRETIENLRVFNNRTHFRKEALNVMVNLLSEAELRGLRKAFKYCDKNNTGEITISELHEVMQELGYNDTDQEIMKIIRQIHIDERDHIRYTEFLAAALDNKFYSDKERLWMAFKYFDIDDTGYITTKNFKEVMARAGKKLSDTEISNMIREVDIMRDGRISFDGFCIVMQEDHKQLDSSLSQDEDRSSELNDFVEVVVINRVRVNRGARYVSKDD